jgi:hypothetical protein
MDQSIMESPSRCWICKQIADSAEHRIKKSDLVNLHGSGSYKGDNALVLIRGDQEIPIRGPNSKFVKYRKILCSKCNNSFSQPFDKSYEAFVLFLLENEDLLLKRRFIDFKEVYGEDFAIGQRNLYKYFAKSFGCRIANDGYPIPKDLTQLFFKERFRTNFRITFSVNEDALSFPHLLGNLLGNGSLDVGVPLRETRPTLLDKWQAKKYGIIGPLKYRCYEEFKWLTTWFWYDIEPNGTLGSTWVANSRYIYLGSHVILSDDARQQMLSNTDKL